MTDTTTDNGNGDGRTPVTKGDIINQDIDKVFPAEERITEEPTTSMTLVTRRPGFTAEDYDAAKRLAMTGPFVPAYLRGNPGWALGILELAHRYSKYDERTNSWVSFTPTAIASQTYIVEGKGGATSIGYTSQFIGAILDAFVPWSRRMRYRYEGEGQTRRCTAVASLRDDPEPFEYTTPPLSEITPKNSPLWQVDPDRQLAYYARRAWARLFTPGVLLGIYDVDELEGRAHQEAHKVRDEGNLVALHDRLAAAKEAAGTAPREGFQPEAAKDLPTRATETQQEAKKPSRGRVATPRAAKRAVEPRKGKDWARRARARQVERQAERQASTPKPETKPADLPRLPTNPREYAKHVNQWLSELNTEEAIADRWRREMNLRNLCGVIEEERRTIRAVVDQRIATLKGGTK